MRSEQGKVRNAFSIYFFVLNVVYLIYFIVYTDVLFLINVNANDVSKIICIRIGLCNCMTPNIFGYIYKYSCKA